MKRIEETFIDTLRGLFHPRIDYAKAVSQAPRTPKREPLPVSLPPDDPAAPRGPETARDAGEMAAVASTKDPATPRRPSAKPESAPEMEPATSLPQTAVAVSNPTMPVILDDDEPLEEVPQLPKRNGNRNLQDLQPSDLAKDADDQS